MLSATQTAPLNTRGERIWWVDDVAVVTNGESLLADDSTAAPEEFLFTIARPDLVVADHGFAGHALQAGLEVVAFADLDAVALAVAAWRGMAIRIVPLDEHRPPHQYAPLLQLLEETRSGAHESDAAADLPVLPDIAGPR